MLLQTLQAVARSLSPAATVKSDYSDPNRGALAAVIDSVDNQNQSWRSQLYSNAVAVVNSELDSRAIPLSPSATTRLIENIVSVRNDSKSLCSAHAIEVVTFTSETIEGVRQSMWGEASSTAVGAVANSAGFILAGGLEAARMKLGRFD